MKYSPRIPYVSFGIKVVRRLLYSLYVNSLLTIQQQQPIHILNLVKEFEKDIERAHTLIKKQPVGSQKFEASTNKYEDFKSTFDSYKNKILSFGEKFFFYINILYIIYRLYIYIYIL